MNTIFGKSARGLLALLLGIVLISGIRLIASEAIKSPAITGLDAIIADPTSADAERLNAIRRQLTLARSLSMGDAIVDLELARWAIVAANRPDLSSAQREQILADGLLDARQGIQAQPVSPYAWTMLLAVKRDQGMFDDEFRTALKRATELGPWEPSLLLSQADIGLSAWQHMPAQEQMIIQQVFVRGMQRQSRQLQGIADRHRSPCAEEDGACQ